MAGQLLQVREGAHWKAYHAIRRLVLFDLRGLSGYDDNHPDEYVDGHIPLLFVWNGTPVGTARLDSKEGGTSGVLRLVAILPDYQRQGLGTAMMRAVERLALEAGVGELEVHAARGAVIFYEKLGWSMVDPGKDDPLMKKLIS